jgi:uncharacterized protein (TIGR04222 family)
MSFAYQINPFDLPGPEFLKLYIIVLLVAAAIAWFVRRRSLKASESTAMSHITVDAYEAAYLRGGARLAVDTAIARLVQNNTLAVSSQKCTLSIKAGVPPGAHPIEAAIVQAIVPGHNYNVHAVRASALPAAEHIRPRLEAPGLIVSNADARRYRFTNLMIFLSVMAFGLIKIYIGISRDRPAGFLIMLVGLTVIIALVFGRRPHRTRLGDKALDQLREENAALQATARTRPQQLAGSDVALALGLFGVEALAFQDGGWSDLKRTLNSSPPSTSGAMSCGGSSCGSGCGGGCGGGGCGGCGG